METLIFYIDPGIRESLRNNFFPDLLSLISTTILDKSSAFYVYLTESLAYRMQDGGRRLQPEHSAQYE